MERGPDEDSALGASHAMQIFRYAEQGSIDFLCVSCTNPAVFLPELHRTRDILEKEDLFVVGQDIFLTETADSFLIEWEAPRPAQGLIERLEGGGGGALHVHLLPARARGEWTRGVRGQAAAQPEG